jgi:hypothetical protein
MNSDITSTVAIVSGSRDSGDGGGGGGGGGSGCGSS